MRKLICLLLGHKMKKMLFTEVCLWCAKADVLDETMDQFVPTWRDMPGRCNPVDRLADPKKKTPETYLGFPIIVDETLAPGTIELRNGKEVVRVINLT